MYRHITPFDPPAGEPDNDAAAARHLAEIQRFREQRDASRQGIGGPKTPEGKRISSLNALRSGIHGQITCLPAEDLAECNRIVASILKELQPSGEQEKQLAVAIGEAYFRLARCRAVENSLFAQGYRTHIDSIDSGHPEVNSALCNAETWAAQHKQFMNNQLYETRLSNLLRRQTEQFNQLKAARKAACKRAEDEALLLLRFAESKGETYEPGDDFQPPSAYGEFVFSADALRRRWDRECRLESAKKWAVEVKLGRATEKPGPKMPQAA